MVDSSTWPQLVHHPLLPWHSIDPRYRYYFTFPSGVESTFFGFVLVLLVGLYHVGTTTALAYIWEMKVMLNGLTRAKAIIVPSGCQQCYWGNFTSKGGRAYILSLYPVFPAIIWYAAQYSKHSLYS